MAGISAIFFDIGGVLGTNGWDHESRHRAASHFGIERQALETVHAEFAEALDTSTISVEDYINNIASATAVNGNQKFDTSDFLAFMKNESLPDVDAIAQAARLSASKKYYMATLNNESSELNDYRIDKFGLSPYFQAFFSSGYLGVRKPNKLIYERALKVSHQQASQTLFIDDRDANLEIPHQLGFQTIQFTSAAQLEVELNKLGLGVSASVK